MTQPGGAERAFERMLVSDPYEKENGNVVRSFYHSAVGYGQVEATADSVANVASVIFYDLPGGTYAAVQPNYDSVIEDIRDDSRDLELGKKSPAHKIVLGLAEKALGLQIAPPTATLINSSRLYPLEDHLRSKFKKDEYGTSDSELLIRIEALVGRIISSPEEELVKYDWEVEEERELKRIDDQEGWQTIPDPRIEEAEIEAAPIIVEDPDYGTRSFAIVSKREDGSMRKVAFLYHPTAAFPKQLLMMPANPKDNVGSILMSWNSVEAERFLTAAEKLLGIR